MMSGRRSSRRRAGRADCARGIGVGIGSEAIRTLGGINKLNHFVFRSGHCPFTVQAPRSCVRMYEAYSLRWAFATDDERNKLVFYSRGASAHTLLLPPGAFVQYCLLADTYAMRFLHEGT